MELNICHLYPDILNLYGDRGNIITMKRRMEDRGIKVNVEGCSIGETLDANRYDIFFIGGGQDFEQEVLLKDLGTGKAAEIRAAVKMKRPSSQSAEAIRCLASIIRPGMVSSSILPARSTFIPLDQKSV